MAHLKKIFQSFMIKLLGHTQSTRTGKAVELMTRRNTLFISSHKLRKWSCMSQLMLVPIQKEIYRYCQWPKGRSDVVKRSSTEVIVCERPRGGPKWVPPSLPTLLELKFTTKRAYFKQRLRYYLWPP